MNTYKIHMSNATTVEICTEQSLSEVLGDVWATGVYLWRTKQGEVIAVFKEHIVCVEKVIDRHEG